MFLVGDTLFEQTSEVPQVVYTDKELNLGLQMLQFTRAAGEAESCPLKAA